MASRPLTEFSAALSAARSAIEALSTLNADILELDRGAILALYDCDQRQGAFCRRTVLVDGEPRSADVEVSLDHLPAAARRALNEAKIFTELGAQSDDYMKLLGFPAAAESGLFYLRGCAFDGELIAVLALFEPKRRFGQKVSERIAPAVDLFATALERLSEREARLEATSELERLTRHLHAEHERAIGELKRLLDEARLAASGQPGNAESRIAELQKAAEVARLESRTTAQRLTAVEEQVASAVGRLERAHRQIHEQSEAIRQQRNLIYRIERMLRDAAGGDSEKLVADLLAVVSSTPAPLDHH